MKKCYECGFECDEKDALKYFSKNKTKPDGLQGQCKICRAEIQREYREKNKKPKKHKTIKVCSKCGFTCEMKVAAEFFCKQTSRKDELKSHCNKCRSNSAKVYRETEHGKAIMQRYQNSERRLIAAQKYQNSEKGKATSLKCKREYRASARGKAVQRKSGKKYRLFNPEKMKAKSAVHCAIRSGELVRPDRCSNPKCNKLCVPEGHHWSYLEEYWLDVEWLCCSCHKKLHKKERERKRNEISSNTNVISSNS